MTAPGPQIASAALLLRDDGQLLLVRHRSDDPQFAGLWSLPLDAVADDEVAEAALERLLRERLHVQPGPFEFAETLYLAGAGGDRYIVNVFTCVEWDSEPRFAEEHYQDAAWVRPGAHGSLALVPELDRWLLDEFAGAAPVADPASLASSLEAARQELLTAYEAIPAAFRDRPLDSGWCALDVLAHASSVEAYYAAESRRLLETPGHTWRGFNERQWEDDHRARDREPEGVLRARLDAVRERTAGWLATLSEQQLATYGNHAERGVVTIADRVDKIARHDREHAAQLKAMLQAARVQRGSGGETGAEDVAADR